MTDNNLTFKWCSLTSNLLCPRSLPLNSHLLVFCLVGENKETYRYLGERPDVSFANAFGLQGEVERCPRK